MKPRQQRMLAVGLALFAVAGQPETARQTARTLAGIAGQGAPVSGCLSA